MIASQSAGFVTSKMNHKNIMEQNGRFKPLTFFLFCILYLISYLFSFSFQKTCTHTIGTDGGKQSRRVNLCCGPLLCTCHDGRALLQRGSQALLGDVREYKAGINKGPSVHSESYSVCFAEMIRLPAKPFCIDVGDGPPKARAST